MQQQAPTEAAGGVPRWAAVVRIGDSGGAKMEPEGVGSHFVSASPPYPGLTSDLLLTKARKPKSRLAEELREPWDSRRRLVAPPANSGGGRRGY